jgi:hypothetical protein
MQYKDEGDVWWKKNVALSCRLLISGVQSVALVLQRLFCGVGILFRGVIIFCFIFFSSKSEAKAIFRQVKGRRCSKQPANKPARLKSSATSPLVSFRNRFCEANVKEEAF